MATTIKWLLEQEIMEGFSLLTGNGNEDKRIINGINIMDNPDTVRWLKGGELILSTGYFLTSPQNYRTLIKDLDTRGCSGLGIKMNRYIDELPEEMISQADELSFPILSIPYDSTMDQIANLIYHKIFEEEMNETTKLAAVYREISEDVFRVHNMTHMLRTISQVVDVPMFIVNDTFGIVEYRIPKDSSAALAPPVCEDGITLFPQSDIIYLQAKLKKERVPLLEYTLDFRKEKYDFIIIPIRNHNIQVGFFVCLNENHSIEKKQFDFLTSINSLICIAMMNHNIHTEEELSSLNAFYHKVLTEDIHPGRELESLCIQNGFNYTMDYVCIVLRSASFEQLTMSKRRSTAQKIRLILQEIMENHPLHWDFFTFQADIVLYLFLPENRNNQDCTETFSEFCQKFSDRTPETGISFLFGMSNICTGTKGIKKAYENASSSIELGKKLHPDAFFFSWYRDFIYHVLSNNFDRNQMLEIYEEFLEPLDRADMNGHSELTQTLYHYIQSGQNIAQTAKELYIHRNTMFYRLDQMKELLHIDLKDVDNMFRIQLAFYIKELL